MNETNSNDNAARDAGQTNIVSQFVAAFEASEDPNKFYAEWEGKMTPAQLDEALAEYTLREKSQANIRGFRRFILGEHEMPIISTGPARRLTRAERAFMGPEDRDEHSED